MYRINKDQILYIKEMEIKKVSAEAEAEMNRQWYCSDCYYIEVKIENIILEIRDRFPDIDVKISKIYFIDRKELDIEHIDWKVWYELF